jgi:PAS domain S-box-containing protein
VTKEGDIAWREVFSKTFTYRGRPANLISLIDITERKKAEEQLKESEEKFRTIAEQHFMGILILQDFQIKYFNNRFLRITGYKKDEIESWEAEEFFKIIHPQDRAELKKKIYQKYVGNIDMIKNFEFRLIQKSGEIIWVEIFSKTIPYKGEEADLTSVIDITERKKAEKQLKESEEKFRNIFEAIPDLFFLVDSSTKVIEYKGKPEKLYLPPEEFLGKKLTDLLPVALGKKAEIAIRRTTETREQQILDYSLPINNIDSYYEARLLYYGNDQVAIFIRDISQRKKAEQMIKEEVKRLKEIDDMRRDLISRVSHELKTPIMAISGATEYLLETYKNRLGEEPIHFLNMIDSNESRLEKLIENLLDISRINYQKIHLAKQKCNICSLIKDVSAEMEYLRRERDLEIQLDLPNELELEVDKIRIEQVIMNLLSNAIKNTPPGGLIRVSVNKSKHYIQIFVADEGIGFTDDEIDKLFTQFGKIERYGEGLEYLDISGSGLGLYISKKIVEMHNGEITVESKGRNKGSIFKVYLPRK